MSHTPDSLSNKTLLVYSAILALIWGSAFTMIGVGVRHMSPIWLVAYRLVIGAILVTLYAMYKKQRFPSLSDSRWLWYLCLGITGSVLPFFLISTGQVVVDSGISAIIIGIMPIMTIILAHFFTEEKLTLMKLLGFFIGFLGIVILFLPDNLSLNLVQDWTSQLLIIAGAFCYAVTTVGAKRAPKTPSSIAAAMMLIMAALIAVVFAVISGVPETLPAIPGLLAALGLGIGSTGIATILYLYVLQMTGPSLLARINYFVPAVSVFLGVIYLNEPISWRLIISFAIIFLGVVISRRDLKKPITPKTFGP